MIFTPSSRIDCRTLLVDVDSYPARSRARPSILPFLALEARDDRCDELSRDKSSQSRVVQYSCCRACTYRKCLVYCDSWNANTELVLRNGRNCKMRFQHSLSIAQITAALIQTVCILRKLFIAALLHLSEKVECTTRDSFSLSQALSRIVQLLCTQHIFLKLQKYMICFDSFRRLYRLMM